MSTTLLQGVNKVLRRVQVITSDITSLTSSGKQPWIDACVGAWNEAMIDLYATAEMPYPSQSSSSTITLVTSTRSYSLASDLIKLHWPLHDQTNGQYISEYEGGFLQLQQEEYFTSEYTGLPYRGAIDPTDGTIYLDYIPTSTENGRVYTYYYDKNLEMSATTDVFPFNNHVYIMLARAVAELWRLEVKYQFNDGVYKKAMSNAAKALRQQPQRESWLPMRASRNTMDPFEENG